MDVASDGMNLVRLRVADDDTLRVDDLNTAHPVVRAHLWDDLRASIPVGLPDDTVAQYLDQAARNCTPFWHFAAEPVFPESVCESGTNAYGEEDPGPVSLQLPDGSWRSAGDVEEELPDVIGMALSAVRRGVGSFLRDIIYLGPFRQPGVLDWLDEDGWRQPWQGAAAVNRWLNGETRLGLPYRLTPDNRLRDTRTDLRMSFGDVGFGVSQCVPILLAASLEGRVILIEQPELHLHPALQARMGDVFIDSVNNGNTHIIETHSEHLLLRLMRRMRQTVDGTLEEPGLSLKPAQIAVFYVDQDETGSMVRELPLSERGELVKPWPGGFFEEALDELM